MAIPPDESVWSGIARDWGTVGVGMVTIALGGVAGLFRWGWGKMTKWARATDARLEHLEREHETSKGERAMILGRLIDINATLMRMEGRIDRVLEGRPAA